ncbi:MAG: hypothetical protein WCF03_16280 [Nitrososphaeraceae archaeon]
MLANTLLKKTRSNLVWIILPLSAIALLTEVVPEVEAKIIVVPTLILMIVLCVLELSERCWNIKQNHKEEFK